MPVLRRGPNVYLRQTQDRLVFSSEHRAASASVSAPVYLELVGTDTEMAHLEVVAELKTDRRRSLQEQALDLLSHGAVLTRAKLRDCLSVQNERLGVALESLEPAGRTPVGWQRLDRSIEEDRSHSPYRVERERNGPHAPRRAIREF